MSPESFLILLSLDTCRDPDGVKFWSLEHLCFRTCHAEKWRTRVGWEKSFFLHLWCLVQRIVWNIFAFIAYIRDWWGVHSVDCQLSSCRVRSRFRSPRHYDHKFASSVIMAQRRWLVFNFFNRPIFSGSGSIFQGLACLQVSHWWRQTPSFAYKLEKIWEKEIIFILLIFKFHQETLSRLFP